MKTISYIETSNQSKKQLYKHLEINFLENFHDAITRRNLLLTIDLRLKIADFGISKILDSTISSSNKGTYYYMSPEIIANEKYGLKCDIWY